MNSGDNADVGKVDIRGVLCPYTFIRAKIALENIECGKILEILLDNEMALKSLPKAFICYGQEYLGTERVSNSEWIIRIRKRQ
ncbi:MAG: sulfurtransferase TusA family protein [Deltaproteobacteria bacterium]|nr:sulfurtransferase TusA family protein [Deltaproteobacteria bacterium]